MMTEAVLSFSNRTVNNQELEILTEAFRSKFSLDEIASAYSLANSDGTAAAEILSNTNSAKDATSSNQSSNLKILRAKALELEHDKKGKNVGAEKSKSHALPVGTASILTQKEYVRPKLLEKGFPEPNKHSKMDTKEMPVSAKWNEGVIPSMRKEYGPRASEVEDFLFEMLREGFQLGMTKIREVLVILGMLPCRTYSTWACGYDMQKGMDELLALSARNCGKSNDVDYTIAEDISFEFLRCSYVECEVDLCENQAQGLSLQQEYRIWPASTKRNRTGSSASKTRESTTKEKERKNLQNEILQSLFTLLERTEDTPQMRRTNKPFRSLALGKVVENPYTDITPTGVSASIEPIPSTRDDEGDGSSYEEISKAEDEYWNMMKEYYNLAVDAFMKGNRERANKFVEKGHAINRMFREAKEKAHKKIIKPREGEIFCWECHGIEPKQALHLFKMKLVNISRISLMKYLKVTVGIDGDDKKTRTRKQLILKLLESESVQWTEEQNGMVISIQIDELDPKQFSFYEKYRP